MSFCSKFLIYICLITSVVPCQDGRAVSRLARVREAPGSKPASRELFLISLKPHFCNFFSMGENHP